MQIDWWTLALQGINFLVLVWLLWRVLYRPVKEVIEKRRAIAEQAFAEAEKMKNDAEVERERFEAGQSRLGEEREDMLRKISEESAAERQKILEEARDEARQMLEETRKTIAEEREAALIAVREQVVTLAMELASSLLRTVEMNGSRGSYAELLERHLQGLPADERERLQMDLATKSAPIKVVTAVPLTPAEQDQWTDRLSASLNQKHEIGFASDPGIVGGAELHLPHAVVKFTWADQLQKARELLQSNEHAS